MFTSFTDVFPQLSLCPPLSPPGGVSSPIRPLSPAHRPGRSSSSPPVVALRMEMGPAAARHSPLSESVGFLELQVVGCRAELLASSLGGLGPFLEDELAADVQPMKIRLRDTVLTLKVWPIKEDPLFKVNFYCRKGCRSVPPARCKQWYRPHLRRISHLQNMMCLWQGSYTH